jgi:hypothetical protein
VLNIHRIDHEASHTHCWRVTVQCRTRVYMRSFSDGRYGGAQQALPAATTYRDELISVPSSSEQASLLRHSQEDESVSVFQG